ILRGEGIDVSADSFHLLGNFLGRALARAFEKQMLDEMRNAADWRRFMTSPDSRPKAHGNAAHVRKIHRGDTTSVGQGRQVIRVIHYGVSSASGRGSHAATPRCQPSISFGFRASY